jgi:hypothetical protein
MKKKGAGFDALDPWYLRYPRLKPQLMQSLSSLIDCGAQFGATAEPPGCCAICEDERQFVH